MEELQRRGEANGLTGIRRLAAEEICEIEPHAAGVAGLFVPQTGIVDYVRVTEAYADEVRRAGGQVMLSAPVRRIVRDGDGMVLETAKGPVRCRFLINCAGLHSDRIARLAGVDPGVCIVPFRGEYYDLIPERHHLVRNLIYPVPDPEFPFLGVHFTRMIGGGVEAGPNAVLAFKREGYTRWSFSPHDVLTTVTFGGFWRMAGGYWRMGLGEYWRSFNRRAFVKALRRLVPEISTDDLKPGGAGVRAQALDPRGKLLDDFRIVEAERQVHVLNAPSPAATASISIGEAIAGIARKTFGIDE
jgi:L-2-hydroxyglutarate oxidase